MGPPFDDVTVLPSPSFMAMACGRLDSERKTCLQLNIWCEAPECKDVRNISEYFGLLSCIYEGSNRS